MKRNRIGPAIVIIGLLSSLLLYLLLQKPTPSVQTIEENVVTETAPIAEAPALLSQSGVVKKNTSFFDLLLSHDISPQEIHGIAKSARPVYNFKRIYPGQSYELLTDEEGGLAKLKFSISDERYVEVRNEDGSYKTKMRDYQFDVVRRTASGSISHSLFAAIDEQSIPLEIGIKLSDIFAWDIDFFTDVRKDDYFRVIYEEKTRSDGLRKIGDIIAAEFNTRGHSHYAFLYENEKSFADYYDENGKSLRKQLLKAPLSYTRISSNFSRRRFHPILHRYTPHTGIDYAAPHGTPVMATGDGSVMTASRTRANGNYIKIKHNSNYITYYLHLSRFAKGIKNGAKVRQGQVIGYVGATGYATGPHLDYRVKKNGRFVNPRSLKLPPANPVSQENMAEFKIVGERYLASLAMIPTTDAQAEHHADNKALSTVSKVSGKAEKYSPSPPSTSR